MWSLSMPSSVAAKKLDLGRRLGEDNDKTRMLVEVSKGDKHRFFFFWIFLSIFSYLCKGFLKIDHDKKPCYYEITRRYQAMG